MNENDRMDIVSGNNNLVSNTPTNHASSKVYDRIYNVFTLLTLALAVCLLVLGCVEGSATVIILSLALITSWMADRF